MSPTSSSGPSPPATPTMITWWTVWSSSRRSVTVDRALRADPGHRRDDLDVTDRAEVVWTVVALGAREPEWPHERAELRLHRREHADPHAHAVTPPPSPLSAGVVSAPTTPAYWPMTRTRAAVPPGGTTAASSIMRS